MSASLREPVPPFVCKVVTPWKGSKKGELTLKGDIHLKVTEVSSDKLRWLGEYDEGKAGWFPKANVVFVGDWAVGTHTLYMHHFNSPTWCSICQQFIWGLGKQGLRCSLCKMPVHKKCLRKVSNNCHEGISEVASGVLAPKRSFSKIERGKLPPSLSTSLGASSSSPLSSSSSSPKPRRGTVDEPGSMTEILKMTELIDWLDRAIRGKHDGNALQLKNAIMSLLDQQKQADPAQPYGVFLPLKEKLDAVLKKYRQTVGMRIVEANIPTEQRGREQLSDSTFSSDDTSGSEEDSFDDDSGFDGYNTFGMNRGRYLAGI